MPEGDRGDRGHHRHRRAGRDPRQREDRRGRRRHPGGGDRAHPAAAGRPGRAAAGADHRLLVRQLRRRRDAGARVVGDAAAARQDPADGTGASYLCEQVGVFTPKVGRAKSLAAGEVGFVIAGHQGAAAPRRSATRSRSASNAGGEAAAGLQGNQAAGVRRPLSGRVEPVRGAARRAREAAAERRVAALRAGILAGAGLRLPLRLPRPAAHGHRAGAARARVRHGPHHDGADRGLPGPAARRHACIEIENPSKLPDLSRRRGDPRADHRPARSSCRRTTSAR